MHTTSLSRLTVIIPTVARPDFVRRQFEYWGNLDAEVFILDGAKTPIEIPPALQTPKVRYIHSGNKFNERLAQAWTYVKTEFAALLPDDEFYLPSGLDAAIRRLDASPHVVGCVGRCLFFFVDQGRFLVADAYREWQPFASESMSLADRLDADLPPNKTHKAQFAVLRSPVWKEMFENSYQTYFSCGYTYERLLNLQRSISGTTVILEDLLWMRSMENPPISNESVPRVGGRDFVSWVRNPEFVGEVEAYRGITRSLLRQGGVLERDVETYVSRFIEGGVKRQADKEERNRRKIVPKVAKWLVRKTPKRLRLLAKRLLPNWLLRFADWQGFDLDTMCASLTARGTSFSRAELERVKQLSLQLDISVRARVAVDG